MTRIRTTYQDNSTEDAMTPCHTIPVEVVAHKDINGFPSVAVASKAVTNPSEEAIGDEEDPEILYQKLRSEGYSDEEAEQTLTQHAAESIKAQMREDSVIGNVGNALKKNKFQIAAGVGSLAGGPAAPVISAVAQPVAAHLDQKHNSEEAIEAFRESCMKSNVGEGFLSDFVRDATGIAGRVMGTVAGVGAGALGGALAMGSQSSDPADILGGAAIGAVGGGLVGHGVGGSFGDAAGRALTPNRRDEYESVETPENIPSPVIAHFNQAQKDLQKELDKEERDKKRAIHDSIESFRESCMQTIENRFDPVHELWKNKFSVAGNALWGVNPYVGTVGSVLGPALDAHLDRDREKRHEMHHPEAVGNTSEAPMSDPKLYQHNMPAKALKGPLVAQAVPTAHMAPAQGVGAEAWPGMGLRHAGAPPTEYGSTVVQSHEPSHEPTGHANAGASPQAAAATTAQAAAPSARRADRGMLATVSRHIAKNPLAAAGLAAGAGFLVGKHRNEEEESVAEAIELFRENCMQQVPEARTPEQKALKRGLLGKPAPHPTAPEPERMAHGLGNENRKAHKELGVGTHDIKKSEVYKKGEGITGKAESFIRKNPILTAAGAAGLGAALGFSGGDDREDEKEAVGDTSEVVKSQDQAKFLNWRFGHDWVKKHHYDQSWKDLPQKVGEAVDAFREACMGNTSEGDVGAGVGGVAGAIPGGNFGFKWGGKIGRVLLPAIDKDIDPDSGELIGKAVGAGGGALAGGLGGAYAGSKAEDAYRHSMKNAYHESIDAFREECMKGSMPEAGIGAGAGGAAGFAAGSVGGREIGRHLGRAIAMAVHPGDEAAGEMGDKIGAVLGMGGGALSGGFTGATIGSKAEDELRQTAHPSTPASTRAYGRRSNEAVGNTQEAPIDVLTSPGSTAGKAVGAAVGGGVGALGGAHLGDTLSGGHPLGMLAGGLVGGAAGLYGGAKVGKKIGGAIGDDAEPNPKYEEIVGELKRQGYSEEEAKQKAAEMLSTPAEKENETEATPPVAHPLTQARSDLVRAAMMNRSTDQVRLAGSGPGTQPTYSQTGHPLSAGTPTPRIAGARPASFGRTGSEPTTLADAVGAFQERCMYGNTGEGEPTHLTDPKRYAEVAAFRDKNYGLHSNLAGKIAGRIQQVKVQAPIKVKTKEDSPADNREFDPAMFGVERGQEYVPPGEQMNPDTRPEALNREMSALQAELSRPSVRSQLMEPPKGEQQNLNDPYAAPLSIGRPLESAGAPAGMAEAVSALQGQMMRR